MSSPSQTARRNAKALALLLAATFAASLMLAKPIGYSVEIVLDAAAALIAALVVIALVAGCWLAIRGRARSMAVSDSGAGARILVWLGGAVTVFFALLYGTSVDLEDGGSVHNIGLLNDRLVGVIIGLGLILFGVLRRR